MKYIWKTLIANHSWFHLLCVLHQRGVTKALGLASTLHQKGLAVTGVFSPTLMRDAFVTDIQPLVSCYRPCPVTRP
jgi:hypothetical protein